MFPPSQMAEKFVKTVVLSPGNEIVFSYEVPTLSLFLLGIPKDNFTIKINRPPLPGRQHEKTTSPLGNNITVNTTIPAVFRSALLRLACNDQCASVVGACCSSLFVCLLSHCTTAPRSQTPPTYLLQYPRFSCRYTTSNMAQGTGRLAISR